MEKKKYVCINIDATRPEILKWLNNFEGIEVKRIESLSSGIVYSKLMNMLFPGCISKKKIVLEAREEYQKKRNWSYLQSVFKNVGCLKEIHIDNLIKGKFRDNFEFLQWFRLFFEKNHQRQSETVTESFPHPKTFIKYKQDQKSKNEENSEKPDGKLETQKKIGGRKYEELKEVEALKEEIQDAVNDVNRYRQERDKFYNTLKALEKLCLEALDTKFAARNVMVPDDTDLVKKILEVLHETEELKEDEDLKVEIFQAIREMDILIKERDYFNHKLQKIEMLCYDAAEEKEALGEDAPHLKEDLIEKILQKLYKNDECFEQQDKELISA